MPKLEQMNCPQCGSEMTSGTIEVRGLRTLAYAQQALWWYEDGKESFPVFEPRARANGLRCESCRTIVLLSPPPPKLAAILQRTPNPLARTVYRPKRKG